MLFNTQHGISSGACSLEQTNSSLPPLAPKGTNTLQCTSKIGQTAQGRGLAVDQFKPVPPPDWHLQLLVVARHTLTLAMHKQLQQTVYCKVIP